MTNPVHIELPDALPHIKIVREFDAPVAAVFEAHRDPDKVAQWLGPDGYEMDMQRWDFRTGGGYRYVSRDGDAEYAFHGVFHVVRENEFAIQTFEFELVPDVVSIEAMTFESLGERRSRLTGWSTYPSVEARDGMAQSGMEAGVSEGYRRLDALLDPTAAG